MDRATTSDDPADGYFGESVAARYDETAANLFDPAVLDSAVDFLADLAAGRAALELGIGTGRVALPLAARERPGPCRMSARNASKTRSRSAVLSASWSGPPIRSAMSAMAANGRGGDTASHAPQKELVSRPRLDTKA